MSVTGGVGNNVLCLCYACYVYFLLPGDQEVSKKVEMLGKGEVNWKIFFLLSQQRIKPYFSVGL